MRLASTLFAASLAVTALAASNCNGNDALCERLYSNVTYIGTHNSYAVGTAAADNQAKDVTAQLNDGVRALQVQTHTSGDTINVCHSSCALKDGGTLQDYLTKVAAWMGQNPNDVVTLVMVNINNHKPAEFQTIFQGAGLDKLAYSPKQAASSVDQWPTLGALIDAGTRLVVFLDNSADFTAVPWIIDEFTNMWETKYNAVDQQWACAVDRSDGQSNSMMYMINHFLDQQYEILGQTVLVPDKNKLNETNAADGAGSIGFEVSNCNMLYGRNPNVILLDYYDSNGNAPFVAAAQMNGIPAPTNVVTAGPNVDAAGGSGGAAASGTGSTQMSVTSLKNHAVPVIAPGGLAVLGSAVVGLVAGALML
ncbi:hypothetical protein CcaverHIS002_0308820 [Cutaneotrichosporon cavernicola]|uniref:PLC-like phosphodiesterase n=1 Tax=Cutaneotrichosporon cavernicola TaxID=279322 RepID=A0AA48ID83_9TREE|nr:uncharacterized protein CcaverHIS019_0308670 [Cutaneotrichosporon cavernicola]BEI83014.1 hypothetical protein CcaverHIS002_0308820 [Cutaneotrichosporon cavernicola]BEI90797.1 hypothetical protein CcaverHIS019_0308670 [Cutaneotrichosporon cavernicola]BEI98576.1 hypothetical protein CcaverHIS631_0308750 [Cutaneotrichosporon cavernicola]BEJ06346.1 hypothetical protein CcaverHIS641_0308680 [Cutaneotrichosporon cavernicola]